MASVETYVIQPFHIHRKKLTPSPQLSAKTKHHALAEGQRIGASKPGAAVMRIVADDETSEVSEIEIIGRFGEIPEAFEEGIRSL